MINELKNAADRLKFVSREEIQDEIDASVDESVVLWNDTRKSLRSLCERYENAVKIWAVYRKNSDIVNEWVDNQLNSLSYLSTEDLLNQLHVSYCIYFFIFTVNFTIKTIHNYKNCSYCILI